MYICGSCREKNDIKVSALALGEPAAPFNRFMSTKLVELEVHDGLCGRNASKRRCVIAGVQLMTNTIGIGLAPALNVCTIIL